MHSSHFTDEQLSELIDDEGNDLHVELAECPTCTARFTALRDASAAVRFSEPIDSSLREQAIARAMQDFTPAQPKPARSRIRPMWLTAVAAVAILAVVIPVLRAPHHTSGGTTTAAAPSFNNVSNQAELKTLIRGAESKTSSSAKTDESQGVGALAPMSQSDVAETTTTSPTTCLKSVIARADEGAPILTRTGKWKNTPATFLVFTTGTHDHVIVVDTSKCNILTTIAFLH